jgi:dynein heavy chain 1
VDRAYATFQNIEVMDVTSDGAKTWDAARNTYARFIEKTESGIISAMKTELSDAKSSEEMFQVFGKLNKLLYRPSIRDSVMDFQERLIENVKKVVRST